MSRLALVILLPLLATLPAQAAQLKIQNRRLGPEQTVGHALHQAGLSNPEVESVIAALRPVFDFRRARPGDQLRFVRTDGVLTHFDYRRGPLDEWQVQLVEGQLVGSRREVPEENVVALVDITIEHSLYDSAEAAGESPDVAIVLADVFAWDIDFYRDVQRGDRARALVEKVLSRGRLVRYGKVLAAHYQGSTVGSKRAFHFELPDGESTYFQEDGSSARKTFLKSPLKFSRVTSNFGSRFHPVLKFVKSHNGVDYGAPTGTPVWAVANGVVTRAGYAGAGGNTVCLRHTNGFETCYLHLSGYGAGVKTGARVQQKQVIGYVGTTGRSTGPHLHYALKRGGKYVNPLNQNFPRAEPLPEELRPAFTSHVAELASRLDGGPAVAAAPAPKAPSVAAP